MVLRKNVSAAGLSRKTQAQRRENTQKHVLNSAVRLFGSKGYANTSLDEIAADAGQTITPIYHYFGNKLELFRSVTELMEQRLVERLEALDDKVPEELLPQVWDTFIEVCRTPGFVQIVIIDSPHFLGRERWQKTAVIEKVGELLSQHMSADWIKNASLLDQELVMRMIVASLAEAALMIGRFPDYDSNPIIRRLIELIID